MRTPKVSVLMPVYNGEQYLSAAIDSILKQTFSDYEFIIVLDPSTDNSKSIIESYSDSRIVFLQNFQNIGLAASLNRGLAIAQGEYIVRMDSDDISLPERIARQVEFMETNTSIGITGTLIKSIGEKPEIVINYPTNPETLRSSLLFEPLIAHPTVIMRRDFLIKHQLTYNPAFSKAEDYDLWSRCSNHFSLANIGEVLVLYRRHAGQTQKNNFDLHMKYTGLVRLEELKKLGIKKVKEDEFILHQALSILVFKPSKEFVNKTYQWFIKLQQINQISGYYQERTLAQTLEHRWLFVCKRCAVSNPEHHFI